jgi:metallo-beta-lactamase family protein
MRSLQFLGAAGTVTGSKHLVSTDSARVLVDCGLFQGPKIWRQRNWQPFPVEPSSLNGIVITHAHLDHTGSLPRLYRLGYRGPVYASEGTAELCSVVLPDSGRLQEEDAHFRNRHHATSHTPAEPLYTEQDALQLLTLLRPQPLERPFTAAPGIQVTFHRAAHILGSCFADLQLQSAADSRRILFTGDIGRLAHGTAQTMSSGPAEVQSPVDYLVMESTYGDRLHPDADIATPLAAAISQALARGGTVVIPAFAVERTQKLLFLLKHLLEEGRIPRAPIHVDSPMAIKAVDIFLKHTDEFDQQTRDLIARYGSPRQWQNVYFDETIEQSKAINASAVPCIIISSSGMAAGGRVLHHLAQRLPDARNLVIFVGYQSHGTLGDLIRSGQNPVYIHKQAVPVRAQVVAFEQFSDHADYGEMLQWLRDFSAPPKLTFLVHGEPASAQFLASQIERNLHWSVHVAQWLETVPLP